VAVLTVNMLAPVACSDSQLTSETVNPFRHSVRLLGRGAGSPQGLCLHRTKQHKKGGHISMPGTGFKPMVQMFERSKVIRALDGATTGAGFCLKFFTLLCYK
jgi:hypothetical protein